MYCPNGHPTDGFSAFCGNCGAAVTDSSFGYPAVEERNTGARDVLLGTLFAIVVAGGGLLGYRAYAGGSSEEATASAETGISVVESAASLELDSAAPPTTVTVEVPTTAEVTAAAPTTVVTTTGAPTTATVTAVAPTTVSAASQTVVVQSQPTTTVVVPQSTETVFVQGGVSRFTYSPAGYSNIRSGPGTEYDIIGRTYDGDEVTITSSDGTWSQLASGGWIANTQLNETRRVASFGTAYPVKDQAIRLSPDCDAPEVGVIRANDSVMVTGTDVNGWIPISYHGIVGWSSGHYLVGLSVPDDIPRLCN